MSSLRKDERVTKDFYLFEFFPRDQYLLFGKNCIWLLDPKLPILAQFYRSYFDKKVTINDWKFGGNNHYRGYRPVDSKIGALYSQHKFGRAIDISVDGLDAEEVRNEVRQNFPEFNRAGLTTIEKDTSTWVHSDIRWTSDRDTLFEVPYC